MVTLSQAQTPKLPTLKPANTSWCKAQINGKRFYRDMEPINKHTWSTQTNLPAARRTGVIVLSPFVAFHFEIYEKNMVENLTEAENQNYEGLK